MPQLAHPVSEGETLADGLGDVGLGLPHRLPERPALRETGRDGRREGAARAVGVGRLDTRDLKGRHLAPVPEYVHGIALEVAPLDEDVTRAELADPPRGLFHVFAVRDRDTAQHLRL